MSKDVISETINKGVPVATPITIRYCDLYSLCDNKNKFERKVRIEFKKFTEYLSTLFKVEDINLFQTMSILTDPETLEKKLNFSIDGFASSLVYNLNFDNACNSVVAESYINDFNVGMLLPRLEKLKNIKCEATLKKEFPTLYKKYQDKKELYINTRKVEMAIKNSGCSEIRKQVLKSQFVEELNNGGLKCDMNIYNEAHRFNIKTFCEDYYKCLKSMIDNTPVIFDYLNTHPFSLEDISIDKEKLELYIAYRFLISLKSDKDEEKQPFVYYLANYFKENKDRKESSNPSINVGYTFKDNYGFNNKVFKGENITPKNIYLEFRKFLIENPEIKLLNFNDVDFSGMNLQQVEEFTNNYLKIFNANWDVIPKEEGIRIPSDTPYYKHEINYERLNEIFMEKMEFYSELDPFVTIRGKDTFDGYIGYILSNGFVILDKFYENSKKGKVSKGDAAYCMKIEDFYKLSQYPKSVLRKNPSVVCIEHRKGWQDKVRMIISQEVEEIKTQQEINDLVNKELIKKIN